MMRTNRFSAGRALVLLAALVSTGCATKGDLRDLQTEMRALALRQDSLLVELRRQNLTTRDTIRQTSNQLFEIRGDVGTRLGRMEEQLDRLTELVGQNQRTMASIRDQMESGMRRPGGGTSGGGMGDLGVPVGGGGSPADAVTAYNAAVQTYNQGMYTAASIGFQDFIDGYPSDDLVADAYFFLGEALVQMQDLDGALDAYRQVTELHPGSDRVPGAMLGIGLTLIDQGDTTEARIILNRLIETYGASESAARAREALAALGGL